MNMIDEFVGPTRDWIVGHRELDLPRARLTPALAAKWFGYEKNRDAHAWVLRHPGEPRPC